MMNQEKIQELVSRSQQDDKRAFALLVSEFQPLVFRLAFRLLCDEEEARDITQETFVKVWLSLKTYNQENRLSTWLYKITCNTCYDRLRSLRHSPLDNESAFSDSVNIPSDDHIEISLSNKQLKELLNAVTDEDTRDFIEFAFTMILKNNWFFVGLLINSLKEDDKN